MILTLKSKVEKWMDRITQTAIRDGIVVWRAGPAPRRPDCILRRPRRQTVNQAQLRVLRATQGYFILTSVIAIAAGVTGYPTVGFAIWFFGLVMPLIFLLIWRRYLER